MLLSCVTMSKPHPSREMTIKERQWLVSREESLMCPVKQLNLELLASSGLEKHTSQRMYGPASANRLRDEIESNRLIKYRKKKHRNLDERNGSVTE